MKKLIFLCFLLISAITADAQRIKPKQIKAQAEDQVLVSEEISPGKYRYAETTINDLLELVNATDTRIDSIWQNADSLFFRSFDLTADTLLRMDTLYFEDTDTDTRLANGRVVGDYLIFDRKNIDTGSTVEVNADSVDISIFDQHDIDSLVLFGDSFTASLTAPTRYPSHLIQSLNLKGTVSYAVPGNTMRQVAQNLDDLIVSNTDGLKGFSHLIMMAGVNDFARDTILLGSVENNPNAATYVGQLKRFIEASLTANRKIKIFIMTPPEAFLNATPYQQENSMGWTMKELSSVISEVGNLYGLPVINLFSQSRWNLFTKDSLVEDLVHPNELGARRLAEIIKTHLVNNISTGQVTSYAQEGIENIWTENSIGDIEYEGNVTVVDNPISVGRISTKGTSLLIAKFLGRENYLAGIHTTFSKSAMFLGTGVKPSYSTLGAFESTTSINRDRTAIEIGRDGAISFYTGSKSVIPYGDPVTLNEVMRIEKNGGGRLVIPSFSGKYITTINGILTSISTFPMSDILGNLDYSRIDNAPTFTETPQTILKNNNIVTLSDGGGSFTDNNYEGFARNGISSSDDWDALTSETALKILRGDNPNGPDGSLNYFYPVPFTRSTNAIGTLALGWNTSDIYYRYRLNSNSEWAKIYTDQNHDFLLGRSNHTGTQPATTITGLSPVATTGDYNDLTNTPSFATSLPADSITLDLSNFVYGIPSQPNVQRAIKDAYRLINDLEEDLEYTTSDINQNELLYGGINGSYVTSAENILVEEQRARMYFYNETGTFLDINRDSISVDTPTKFHSNVSDGAMLDFNNFDSAVNAQLSQSQADGHNIVKGWVKEN